MTYPRRTLPEIKNNADTATIVQILNDYGDTINEEVQGVREYGPAPYRYHEGNWFSGCGPSTHGCGAGHPYVSTSPTTVIGTALQYRDEFNAGIFRLNEPFLVNYLGTMEAVQSADVDAPVGGQTYTIVLIKVEVDEETTYLMPTEIVHESGTGTLGTGITPTLHAVSPAILLDPGLYGVGLLTNAASDYSWGFPVAANAPSEALETRIYGGAYSRNAMNYYRANSNENFDTAADILLANPDDSGWNYWYPVVGVYGSFRT